LSNEHADGAVADDITHSIHSYNILLLQAFLLLIELHLCGRVVFSLAENYVFDSNSAASTVLGLNALLFHSFTLLYLTLE
jgi:hypothetical protein